MARGTRMIPISFQKRIPQGNDGLGNELSDWVEQFQQSGDIKFLRGGEDVIAARLQGRQPGILKVLQSENVDLVTPDWRVQDIRTGQYYNVRSVEPHSGRKYVEFLIESGVADG